MRPLLFAASLLIATPALAQTQSGAPVEVILDGKPGGTSKNPLFVTGGGGGSSGGGSASDPSYVSPGMLSGVNLSAVTDTSGTAYVAFGSQACRQLTIANNTGVTIDVQQGGSGVAVPVFNSTYYTFFGLTNANQLGVKRDDSRKTVVTVIARCES